ncbi:hypothetical protein Ga0100231_016635 [Opitutaceae bacterium TAV4]|nr:hypothetical protein Ga0100231_016635 [Opitutaceae bacterium TAV4]RRK02812.1 hypothetical protein Ga0100230_002860 [Opitutaceae bacterium TAV3]
MLKTEVIDDGQKRDRRGRVNWPKARREELVAEYEGSGLSQAAFARRAGVRYPTFVHWVQQARRKPVGMSGSGRQPVVPRFAEVCIGADKTVSLTGPEMSVTLPGGLVARGSDAAGLATLVRALLSGS